MTRFIWVTGVTGVTAFSDGLFLGNTCNFMVLPVLPRLGFDACCRHVQVRQITATSRSSEDSALPALPVRFVRTPSETLGRARHALSAYENATHCAKLLRTPSRLSR